MEHYDVIIIGAGIAGCGLAYNLRKICSEKKVLIIDKEEPGANAAYGIREASKETVDTYNLHLAHIFKGLKVGTYDNIHITIKKKFFFIDYKKSCEKLISVSKATYRQEKAILLKTKQLTTNKEKYSFDVLVDATGHDFFVRNLLKKSVPMRYWIGITYILENKTNLENYFYCQFSDDDFLEEMYILENKTLYGKWEYTKKVDFKLIKPHNRTLFNKYLKKSRIIKENKVVIPCAHVAPFINKHCICLGDSFGNATTSSASGIDNILDTSKLLAESLKNNNLKLFQKEWGKKYLNDYNKFLTSKLDTFNNGNLMKFIKRYPTRTDISQMFKKYPEKFVQILDGNTKFTLPKEIKNKFPLHQKIFQFYYYVFIKIKYQLSKL